MTLAIGMIQNFQEYLMPTTDSDEVKRKLGKSLSRENVAAKGPLSARVEGALAKKLGCSQYESGWA